MCCLTLFFERSKLMSTWPIKRNDERPVRIPSRVQRGKPTDLIRVPHRSMSERLFIGTELIQIHMPHQKLTIARETAHKSCNSEASWTAYKWLQVGDLSFPDSLAGLSFFRSGWLIWAMSKQLSCLRMFVSSFHCLLCTEREEPGESGQFQEHPETFEYFTSQEQWTSLQDGMCFIFSNILCLNGLLSKLEKIGR